MNKNTPEVRKKVKQWNANWRARNPGYDAAYQAANRERITAYKKAWRAAKLKREE